MAKTISAEAILNTPQNQLNLKKYAQRIKIAESVQKKSGKSFGFEQKVALATMLENTRKIMEAAGQGATNSSNIPSKKFFMDMVTAVVPNLIASDIVSTQAMESKASIVSYLRYLYGTDKGATVAGTMFNNSLYTGKSDPNYSSRLIVDEQVVDGVNFEYSPILPGTVVITLPDNTTVIDNGTGNLVDPSTSAQVGTINYATGAFTCATTDSSALSATVYIYIFPCPSFCDSMDNWCASREGTSSA